VSNFYTNGRMWAANISTDTSLKTFPNSAVSVGAIQWAEEGHKKWPGLIICGGPGCGKTGVAIGIGQEFILNGFGDAFRWMLAAPHSSAALEERICETEKGRRKRVAPVWYETWTQYERRIRKAMRSGTDTQLGDDNPCDFVIQEEVERQVGLLLLDGIDVGGMTDWREGIMLDIVERPSHRKLTVITLSSTPPELEAQLGARIVDRLMDEQVWGRLVLSGGSLRRGAGARP